MRFVAPRWLFISGLRSAFYDLSRATPEMIDQYWRLNLRPGTREANLARFSLPLDLEPATQLSDIARPTLILWGREDKLISVADAAVFKAALPRSKLII
jgi:pimeloyl-ACP methyl ester carboxylesterase